MPCKRFKGTCWYSCPAKQKFSSLRSLLRPLLPQVGAASAVRDNCPLGPNRLPLCPIARERRKVVLTTDLAETSPDHRRVQVVIDSGYATHHCRFDPFCSGLSRLTTVEISRDRATSGRDGQDA